MESKNTTTTNSPKVILHKEQGKVSVFQVQMKRVFVSFKQQPKTMLSVSVETGILRANICRYVAEWKKENKIKLVKFGICPISKHRAGFYTTNQELFPLFVELIKRAGE
jgi:hypothetical protein